MTEADLWERLSQAPLYLDQTSRLLEMDRQEVIRFYEPLARRVLERRQPGRREIVAIAGPPGSGKTAFATVLTVVLDALAGKELAALVGLDGWHFPNAYLDSHTIQRGEETIPLRRIKGAPETYDQCKILAFLSAARGAERLAYPIYSRELHDPIPEAGVIEPWQQIVVLEGNYWLLDEPPWKQYLPLFDLRIFLKAEPGSLLAGLRERHLRGRKSPGFIAEHMRLVDLPNIERVLNGSGPADVVVLKADSRRISGLEWAPCRS
jgi:putative kinase